MAVEGYKTCHERESNKNKIKKFLRVFTVPKLFVFQMKFVPWQPATFSFFYLGLSCFRVKQVGLSNLATLSG